MNLDRPLTVHPLVLRRHRRRPRPTIAVVLMGLAVASGIAGSLQATFAADADAAAASANENEAAAAREQRLAESVRYLADDALEGRGVGTAGLDKAAEFLAAQFAELGLDTGRVDGSPFQKFEMTTTTKLGEHNEAAFVGSAMGDKPAERIELKLDTDFTPLAIGSSGKLDFPLVFAGYGITGKDEGYDDYAGIDVNGKAVIVLRHEPQQNNPHSAFDGTKDSPLAPFTRKLSNAYEHGAAAVIFCTDEVEIAKRAQRRHRLWLDSLDELAKVPAELKANENPSLVDIIAQRERVAKLLEQVTDQSQKLEAEFDPVLSFRGAGDGSDSPRIPVLHVSRAVLDRLLRAAGGQDLATLEREIDQGPTPHSRELAGWKIEGQINVERQQTEVKNVVAVLEGEGPKANETIVIGAHYDHLGMGGQGSFVPTANEVHNGADDNASGTAALVEVARILATSGRKLPRRVVFIGFTAEERGLIGSARYCANPIVPLEDTVAMLNMDMVGRLKDDSLIVQGFDTAEEFEPLLDRVAPERGFKLSKKPGGFGPSDHSSFFSKQIPVMHFFTGLHDDYHRPSDDTDKVNVPGMRRVAEMVADVATAIADADARPTFKASAQAAPAGGGGDRPYFGSIPDFAQTIEGYAISGVTKDGPAERGGLKAGDVIIRFGESRIGGLEDFDSALRKYKAGDKVPVTVKRDGKDVTVEVKLDPPR